MTPLPDPIGIEDVARLLGRHPDWLRKHLRELIERHGFPRPFLAGRGRKVWHPAAVEAWRLRTAPAELVEKLAEELQPRADLAAARDELLARLDEFDA